MICLVTAQTSLFEGANYTALSVQDSIKMMESWPLVQVDSETSGRNPRLCDILCIQFGNDEADTRIVVDTTTVDIRLYKNILENRLCILHNAKFDLQFLYNFGIIPRRLYDTMIAEQLLYLGWPVGKISYALNSVAERRLGINIDKTVRGEIIWRGLDSRVIEYAAGDVTYLERIMWSQINEMKRKDLMRAAKIEFDFIPAIAYLEWCGIHLDQKKWKNKMASDQKKLEEAKEMLNKFVESREDLREYVEINNQGDLFTGFDTSPKCNVNWNSSIQVVKLAKKLGFDTSVKDKKTGEDKNSVLEKHLKKQKGVCDEFLELYFDYQEHFKTTTSFGEGHLNAVNPKTDRIHTVYRQLGTASGRMSCGSQQPDTDLAKYKKLKPSDCTFPNIQQLPHDEVTRACFTAPEGYEWCSCDYSA